MSGDPIFVEIDEKSWSGHIDRIAAWLGNAKLAETAYRRLAEQVHGELREPHAKKYVGEAAEVARRHEAKLEEFYRMIGRDPASALKGGEALAAARRAGGNLAEAAGGASGSWVGLHQLYLAGTQAQGAFAVAEQLALAVGLKAMAEEAFLVENEKSKYLLLLRELLLELAPIAILYRAEV